ncbi:MAG: NAD-dependent epimerase/dehydratase family protein [Bacillus sp. (in: Bacteria)]|nr:NAD-dependent epimerase/dehydratase family protein [Bacillus sp. (in: firmicutes)]
MKRAMVAGATGLIGKNLLVELIRSGKYKEVIIITRRELAVDEAVVKQYVIDFDKLEDHGELFTGVDDVYVCLGTTMKKAKSKKQFMKVDYTFPLKLAKLAKEANVKQFLIITSIGADRDSLFFYSKVKGKLEEALVTLKLRSLHIFRPSLLVGKREELRFGEKAAEFISKPLSILLSGPLEKYKPVKGEYLAKVMCAVAQEESSGVHIYESDQIRLLGKNLKQSTRREIS